MSIESVGFLGLGFYVPQRVMTNAELEKMVETSDEWIRTRTGISERRIAAEGENTSDLALKATRAALADAKLKPTDLDMLIVATMTPDMPCPATACILQAKLGAPPGGAPGGVAPRPGPLFGP